MISKELVNFFWKTKTFAEIYDDDDNWILYWFYIYDIELMCIWKIGLKVFKAKKRADIGYKQILPKSNSYWMGGV